MTKTAFTINSAVKIYLDELTRQYATGNATEHSYRPALKDFIVALLPNLTVTNEPKRIKCGAPDYILQKNDLPIAFIEAKDIGDTDLVGKKQNKEQFDRYKASLNNLLFTDYLTFHFYQNGELVEKITLAETSGKKIVLTKEKESVEKFAALLEKFGQAAPQAISTAKDLATIMARKVSLLAEVLEKVVVADPTGALAQQWKAFRSVLIHDMTAEAFADMYAQTIAYGMFAARLHTNEPNKFSRLATATLIPKTNPFLRRIFHYITGLDLDDRIAWIVDDLASVFRVVDAEKVMRFYGKRDETDPFLHFYEYFLAAYDPALRKSRGVWYTPPAAVKFIVRAVDDILQRDFGLAQGLATVAHIKAKKKASNEKQSPDKQSSLLPFHQVQVLDPATGTGTFLAEVVECIYSKMKSQQGAWQDYVEQHLLPRLNGFEILMAPYTIAHLKLDMQLAATGYRPNKDQRVGIYLTNSLEEHHEAVGPLFEHELANEANAANRIKREAPVMVVLGNPPYNAISCNRGAWIQQLIERYKHGLCEKKINLDDDYIKFIRLGQHFVERNSEGVLAYISNNSFIDGITHRKMREELLKSFDTIYILNLHGNSKKKETAPDGSKDENVFDIMQGVSINLFIKNGKKQDGELAKIYHGDLFGKREKKFRFLHTQTLESVRWKELHPQAPHFFFVPRRVKHQAEYAQGFSLAEIFPVYNSGVSTDRDPLFIGFNHQEIEPRFKTLLSGKLDSDFVKKYRIEDSSSFKITERIKQKSYDAEHLAKIQYRIFDERYTYYDPTIVSRPAQKVMQHIHHRDNVGLIFKRQAKDEPSGYTQFFVADSLIINGLFAIDPRGREVLAPLYLYSQNDKQLDENNENVLRTPNLKPEIVSAIAAKIKISFDGESPVMATSPRDQKSPAKSFTPLDLFDYIYGVLHSPTYRERYQEFLKTDFPRVPYPKDAAQFWRFAKFGGELRRVHLLEHEKLNSLDTSYAVAGDNIVTNVKYVADKVGGKVYINATQYFGNVNQVAWDFYIGGYQPAQKWLKDRKNRELSHSDIIHYQRILSALTLTAEIMRGIT